MQLLIRALRLKLDCRLLKIILISLLFYFSFPEVYRVKLFRELVGSLCKFIWDSLIASLKKSFQCTHKRFHKRKTSSKFTQLKSFTRYASRSNQNFFCLNRFWYSRHLYQFNIKNFILHLIFIRNNLISRHHPSYIDTVLKNHK